MNVDDISQIVGVPLDHLVFNKTTDPKGKMLKSQFDAYFADDNHFMLPILINVETDDLGLQVGMGHWCAALRDGSALIWFDPSGVLPVNPLGKRFTHYMNVKLQIPNTLTCGIWVGLFFAFRGIGEDKFARIFRAIKNKELFVERLYAYRLRSAGQVPRKGIMEELEAAREKAMAKIPKARRPRKSAKEFTLKDLDSPAVVKEIKSMMAADDQAERAEAKAEQAEAKIDAKIADSEAKIAVAEAVAAIEAVADAPASEMPEIVEEAKAAVANAEIAIVIANETAIKAGIPNKVRKPKVDAMDKKIQTTINKLDKSKKTKQAAKLISPPKTYEEVRAAEKRDMEAKEAERKAKVEKISKQYDLRQAAEKKKKAEELAKVEAIKQARLKKDRERKAAERKRDKEAMERYLAERDAKETGAGIMIRRWPAFYDCDDEMSLLEAIAREEDSYSD